MADTGGLVFTATNGQQPSAETEPSLDNVLVALKAIYDPRSSNQIRQDASTFLESAKRHPQAPALGFQIALDTGNDDALRHFGLSMIEYYIKYVWDWNKDLETEGTLRYYVLECAKGLRHEDPAFIRNKVAQLWTELAKRSWGIEWLDMDAQLVQLWHGTANHQLLVLNVLETLAEEVFSRDDAVAGVRGGDLGDECNEIFMPESTLVELHSSIVKQSSRLRCGDEGWLDRFCRQLWTAVSSDQPKDAEKQDLMIKTLSAMKATIRWINLKAVAAVNLTATLVQALIRGDVPVRIAVVETMNVLFSRGSFADTEFESILGRLYSLESVALFREAYQWAQVDSHDIDSDRYDFLKKLAEALSHLGSWVELRPTLIPQSADLPSLFALFLAVAQHPSMLVSIALLHVWVRLLRLNDHRYTSHAFVRDNFGPLLELCRQRLIRYESVPSGFEDDTLLFLREDFDTVPERHAFVGSYRKYCVEVVEFITLRYPVDVIQAVVNESKTQIASETKLNRDFVDAIFSKNSIPVILVDTHLSVIDAAVKGYHRWLQSLEERDPQKNVRLTSLESVEAQFDQPILQEEEFEKMQDIWQDWCESMMSLGIKDPEALRRIVIQIVTISNKVLNLRGSFAMTVAYFLLNIDVVDNPSYPQYSEAVKSCQYQFVLELQRLAMSWATDLVKVFDDLEAKIHEIIDSRKAVGRPSLGYMAFLFIIVQRAQNINEELRMDRMEKMLLPVKEAWENPEVSQATSDFGSFCHYMGFTPLLDYLRSRQFWKYPDWSSEELDSEGQRIQIDINQRSDNGPSRMTKSLISASFEKVKSDTPTYKTAVKLWTSLMPAILSNLLKLMSHAQAFLNMDNWSALPPEMRQVVQRMVQDRFWQAGISNESREDFFARVSGSKQTYEGLASTVRGSVRQVRETSYNILIWFSHFGNNFYSIDGLPEALSEALYANAHHMSSHHFSVLLSTSRYLIEGCPPHLRRTALTPLLSKLFGQINRKLSDEWNIVYQHTAQAAAENQLGDEMKSESILRQLTYSALMQLYNCLDPERSHIDDVWSKSTDADHPDAKMDKFIMTSPEILEPIFALLNSGLRFRDTRTVQKVIDCIRIIMPHFREPSPAHDFLCSEVLRNAIHSFHEPFFVDSQRDLLKLITELIRFGGTIQQQIILSLTGLEMDREKAQKMIEQIYGESNDKKSRALVWELLSSIRGVSIHEMGKIQIAQPKKKEKREFMDTEGDPAQQIQRGGTPPLEGIGNMFG